LGKIRVQLTETAEAVYRRIYGQAQERIRAGDTTHPKVKLLRIVDDCLNNIIPQDPFNPKRALRGPLSNIFRVKKGRLRICYTGSSEKILVVVLYIAETLRKEGDKRDPYAVFTSMVLSGEFDRVFENLGVRRPARRDSRVRFPLS
jgi:mRNA-degrading endonuclease RelE of RelBE toxin-antitoxin system